MSSKREIQVTCPKCKKISPFTIWSSINTMLDPEMKQAVRDRSAFQFICPDCGLKTYFDYGFLYHRMEDKIMLYYVDSEEDEKAVEQILAGDDPMGMMKDIKEDEYIIRIVRSRNELLEKLEIFDAGLDDRIVELCKVHALAVYQSEHPGEESIETLYYRDQEGKRNCVLIISDGQKKGMTEIPPQLYDDLKEKYSWKLPELKKDGPNINRSWALKVMGVRSEE